MSKKKMGVASNFPIDGKQPRKRMVRDHRFASVDNSNIFNENVDIKSKKEGDEFTISLYNKAPHSIPTGYGLREIIIKVEFFDNANQLISEEIQVLGASWKDKWGKVTIPHLAKSIISDTRLEGKSSRVLKFKIPKNAEQVAYKFSYKLINSEMAKKLGVTDPFFLKEYILSETKNRL
jgi:hypothetical protein